MKNQEYAQYIINEELFRAIAHNAPAHQIISLIAYGANVNYTSYYGNTPLIAAAIHGRQEIVQLLVKFGANVNAKNQQRNTPLMVATQICNKEVIKFLLGEGANINAKNQYGNTALIEAVKCNHKDIVELLVAFGANTHEKNNEGNTALMEAVQYGNNSIVEFFIESVLMNIDDKIHLCDETLLWAKFYGQQNTANFLEELRNRTIDEKYNALGNGLAYAIETGIVEYAQYILNQVECIDEVEHFYGAMYNAIEGGYNEIVKSLAEKVKDHDLKIEWCGEMLECAAISGNIEIVEFFLEKIKFAKSTIGRCSLVLLEVNQKPNCTEIMRLLLDNGANVNTKDREGNTALMTAAKFGDFNTVVMLLKYNTDLFIKNAQGQTAEIIAKNIAEIEPTNTNYTKIVSLLEKVKKYQNTVPTLKSLICQHITDGIAQLNQPQDELEESKNQQHVKPTVEHNQLREYAPIYQRENRKRTLPQDLIGEIEDSLPNSPNSERRIVKPTKRQITSWADEINMQNKQEISRYRY